MRSLSVCESEFGVEIMLKMRNSGNDGFQSRVHSRLFGFSNRWQFDFLLLLTQKILLGGFGSGFLVLGEESVIDLAHIDFADIETSGSRNHIRLIDSTKRNPIDFIRTRHQK